MRCECPESVHSRYHKAPLRGARLRYRAVLTCAAVTINLGRSQKIEVCFLSGFVWFKNQTEISQRAQLLSLRRGKPRAARTGDGRLQLVQAEKRQATWLASGEAERDTTSGQVHAHE